MATLKPGYCFWKNKDTRKDDWEITILPPSLGDDSNAGINPNARWIRSEIIDGAPCDVFEIKCPGSMPNYCAQTQVMTRN